MMTPLGLTIVRGPASSQRRKSMPALQRVEPREDLAVSENVRPPETKTLMRR